MVRWVQAGAALVAAGLLGIAVLAGAGANDRQVPSSAAEMKLSFAPIVKRVVPAVVNVHASRVVQSARSPFLSDPFFRRFFDQRGLGAPTQRVQRSLGSGVIISAGGLVVTNYHVIAGASEVRVTLHDRREFDCEVILKDERTDLAVMRIKDEEGDYPYLEFADSDALEVGDLVLAIGDPFGVGQTVTSGIVSALARTKVGISDYQFFIQTDAAINPGNSGGALIDMNGRLVGINTAIFSRTGDSSGIGFAIPSNMVSVIARSAHNGEHVRLPWVGVRFQAVTADIADGLGLQRPGGALVVDVAPDSPGERAGLITGDLVISVEDDDVDDPSELNYRLATMEIGDIARIGVLRNGKSYVAKLALEPAPETVPRDEVEIVGPSPLTGARVVNLSPAVAEELAYEGEPNGVIVRLVGGGSAAHEAGLAPGDVVVDVNGIRIDTTRTLADICSQRLRVWQITIERDGRLIRTQFRS